MAELPEGLLVLSRSTRGTMHSNRIDLSEMAEQLCAELQQQHPQRRVQWHVEPELVAHGDARMLELVMRNLPGNVWKYTAHVEAASIAFGSH